MTDHWAAHATAHAQPCAPVASQDCAYQVCTGFKLCRPAQLLQQASKQAPRIPNQTRSRCTPTTSLQTSVSNPNTKPCSKPQLHSGNRCGAGYPLRLLLLTTPCCKPAACLVCPMPWDWPHGPRTGHKTSCGDPRHFGCGTATSGTAAPLGHACSIWHASAMVHIHTCAYS